MSVRPKNVTLELFRFSAPISWKCCRREIHPVLQNFRSPQAMPEHHHSWIHILQPPRYHSPILLSQRTLQKTSSTNSILWHIPQYGNTNRKTVPHLIVKCRQNHVSTQLKFSPHFSMAKKEQLSLDTFPFKNGNQWGGCSFPNTCGFCDKHLKPLSLWLFKCWQSANRIEEGNTMRTAWAWAKTLTHAEGKILQCDIKNGGDNQQAQLLVPAEKLNMAWWFLQEQKKVSSCSVWERTTSWKESHKLIPPWSTSQLWWHITNLDLIKGVSPATTWKMHSHLSCNLHKRKLNQSIIHQKQTSMTNKIRDNKMRLPRSYNKTTWQNWHPNLAGQHITIPDRHKHNKLLDDKWQSLLPCNNNSRSLKMLFTN